MLSINMRIFKTILLVASFGVGVRCSPIAETTESKIETSTTTPQKITVNTTPTTAHSDTTDYYDQRQNGTENYRIHVDGVVLLFAPVEALLLAGAGDNSLPNLSNNIGSPIQSISELNKPNIDSIHNKTDPAISKTIHRPALRLVNFLAPLIRRIRHEGSISMH